MISVHRSVWMIVLHTPIHTSTVMCIADLLHERLVQLTVIYTIYSIVEAELISFTTWT